MWFWWLATTGLYIVAYLLFVSGNEIDLVLTKMTYAIGMFVPIGLLSILYASMTIYPFVIYAFIIGLILVSDRLLAKLRVPANSLKILVNLGALLLITLATDLIVYFGQWQSLDLLLG